MLKHRKCIIASQVSETPSDVKPAELLRQAKPGLVFMDEKVEEKPAEPQVVVATVQQVEESNVVVEEQLQQDVVDSQSIKSQKQKKKSSNV